LQLPVEHNACMTVERDEELVSLQHAGRIVRATIDAMARALEPGMTTQELDRAGEAFAELHGAVSGPRRFYDFPGFSCISINDEAVHGVPGSRVVEAGDLVKIDVALEVDGFLADSCTTVAVPPVSARSTRLMRATQSALALGIHRARRGMAINRIGRAVEDEARRHGAHVIRELGGHGIGRHIHEDPSVQNYFVRGANYRLPLGLVFTIEPTLAETAAGIDVASDGWTVLTRDGALTAQFEHTVVVTRGRPLLLTG
jgi:methionyl aminopeptidase